MDNLDDILNGNEEPQVEAPVEAPQEPVSTEPTAETPAEPEAKPEQPRGPDGKFISKGETQPEAPVAESPAAQEPQLDHAALLGERRRRQEAEQRLAELEARINQPQPQPTPVPDQWEDPEGYAKWMQSEAVKQAVEAARHEAFEAFQTQRIAMSSEQFAKTVPDYAEKVQVFEQMMTVNPQLLQELYRAPNPAEYAYNTAKTQIEINQYGGLEGLIAARVQEALKAQAPQPETTPAPPIPESLAAEQSARGAPTQGGPPSLEEILGR